MNDEMKKILSRFLFSGVIICCLGLLTSGGITASQKSAKNTFDKAYAVMNIKNTRESINVNVGEKEYKVRLDLKNKLTVYEDYILLTPLASIYYIYKTVSSL